MATARVIALAKHKRHRGVAMLGARMIPLLSLSNQSFCTQVYDLKPLTETVGDFVPSFSVILSGAALYTKRGTPPLSLV